MSIVEEFYTEVRKRRITAGNIRETERGVFVEFAPRTNRKRGAYRTFKTLKSFIRFLEREKWLEHY